MAKLNPDIIAKEFLAMCGKIGLNRGNMQALDDTSKSRVDLTLYSTTTLNRQGRVEERRVVSWVTQSHDAGEVEE